MHIIISVGFDETDFGEPPALQPKLECKVVNHKLVCDVIKPVGK